MNSEAHRLLGESRSVLIIDDSDTTRRHMTQSLEKHGYRVRLAANGRAALSLLANGPVDAILLDLVMPTMDGWQFRDEQLKRPELAQIPTIAVTVYPLSVHAQYMLRLSSVVQKPFNEEALVVALESACKTRVGGAFAAPDGTPLYWSQRGEIACLAHAPKPSSPCWTSEKWTPVPLNAGSNRVRYQCQHCDGHIGPIARKREP